MAKQTPQQQEVALAGQQPHSVPDVIEQQDTAATQQAGLGQKFTKDEVNYRSAGKSPTRCVYCANYQPGVAGGNTCAKVEGPIRPGDVCDIFVPFGKKPGTSDTEQVPTPGPQVSGGSITDLVGPKGA